MGWDINTNISTISEGLKNQKLNKNIVEYITSPKFYTGNFLRNELTSNSSNGIRQMLSNAERSSSIFEHTSSAIDSFVGTAGKNGEISRRGIFKKTGDFLTGKTDNLLNSQYNSLIKRNLLNGDSVEDAVKAAQKSIKDGKVGIFAKLRGATGKTTDIIEESAESLAKKIANGSDKRIGQTLTAAAKDAQKTGILPKLKKHGGTLFMIGMQAISEWPKIKEAFKEGGIGNGLKQIVKSTVQIGLTEGLTAVATGLVGMIPVVGPAIAASGVVSTVLNMALYSPCQKIAEAVTSLPIFKVEGVQSDTEAMNELKDLGYSQEEIDAACAQLGVSGAAELKELIEQQNSIQPTNSAATAGTISSTGNFSNWLKDQSYAMNPSTGLYV